MRSIFLSLSLLVVVLTNAQYKFALQSSGTSQFYGSLELAYSNAVSGDTIYIPGGAFNIYGGTLQIDKEICLIGVGHYPDSTTATNYSYLNGNIRFITGSDNSSVTGFYLNGNVSVGTGTSNHLVNNLNISRCNINQIQFSYSTTADNSSSSGHLVSECIIRSTIYINNAQNILIEKNIITNAIIGFNGNILAKNNILLYQINCPGYNIGGVGGVFENNVFYNLSFGCTGDPLKGATSSIFTNNLFAYNVVFPYTTNIGSGNIVNVPQADIFINHSGIAFDYSNDYHLSPLSGGQNAGNDGTDVGIYGTLIPYKEGAVPFNPHIIEQTIDPQTNSSGEINVIIKVGAQDL